ncbi:alpha/beta hydrolase [Streptosporangium sp. KLBMP 9127]|nr:alpha/beta hydrolase [Streptosporangium sp. KLBMP 9127]
MRIAVTVGALGLALAVPAPTSALALSSAPVPGSAVSEARSGPKGDPLPEPAPTPDYLLPDVSVETVAYGQHTRQNMDVWWQDDGTRHPAVFLIHGGWWSSGDKKQMSTISRSYAEQGYTVFNINYRLSSEAIWPAQRVDAFDAIMTARRHAARWSFDPGKYVVVGFSAGGHLATAVGTYKDGVPGLKGVVGISPVVSPLTAYNDGRGTLDLNKRKLRTAAIKLAGGCGPKTKGCARMWASMEVPNHASRGDAPTLTVHSEDEFVAPAQSELLKARLRAAGVAMTIRTVPGINHSSPLYRLLGVAEGVHAWIAEKLR